MAPKKKIYQLPEDEANKRLNIGLRTAEKLGLPEDEVAVQVEGYNAEYSSYVGKYYWPKGFEVIKAPTSDKSRSVTGKGDTRNRAIECAYNREAEVLVIVFRAPKSTGIPPLIRYNDVPVEMWENLKQSDSTGKFLKYSGIDDISWSKTSIPALTAEFGE